MGHSRRESRRRCSSALPVNPVGEVASRPITRPGERLLSPLRRNRSYCCGGQITDLRRQNEHRRSLWKDRESVPSHPRRPQDTKSTPSFRGAILAIAAMVLRVKPIKPISDGPYVLFPDMEIVARTIHYIIVVKTPICVVIIIGDSCHIPRVIRHSDSYRRSQAVVAI